MLRNQTANHITLPICSITEHISYLLRTYYSLHYIWYHSLCPGAYSAVYPLRILPRRSSGALVPLCTHLPYTGDRDSQITADNRKVKIFLVSKSSGIIYTWKKQKTFLKDNVLLWDLQRQWNSSFERGVVSKRNPEVAGNLSMESEPVGVII